MFTIFPLFLFFFCYRLYYLSLLFFVSNFVIVSLAERMFMHCKKITMFSSEMRGAVTRSRDEENSEIIESFIPCHLGGLRL